MHTLALAVTLLYALGMGFIAVIVAVSRSRRDLNYFPMVSIIMAARNEEKNIGECLRSITALSYPKKLLEVIVVDDRSSDSTPEIIQQFVDANRFIKLVSAGPSSEGLQGKVNALDQGIAASKGEILMFTDADCSVPKSWVESTVRYYADEKIGIVAGFISIRQRSPLGSVQAIDWYGLLTAASATASIGFPFTAVGNNFSIRRKAYNLVGGYQGIPFSITEDFALLHAVTSRAGMKAVIPLDPESTIITNACRTWKELYSQRKRWFVGGRGMDFSRILVFFPAFVFCFFILFGWMFLPLPTWGIMTVVKLLVDFLMVLPALRSTRQIKLARYWIPFEGYFTLYVFLLPIVVLISRRVEWKGRHFGKSVPG